MAYCKCAVDSAQKIENSTVVTTLCRNGVEFGIRVAHFDPTVWFTGPAQLVKGSYLGAYNEADAGLDMGDSAINETFGTGGFVIAGALGVVPNLGTTVKNAISLCAQMNKIVTAFNPNLTTPLLDFRGAPTGIDVMKVIATQILPLIDTAIAHKEPGIGMIGSGQTHPPMEAFEKAILALAASIK